MLFLDSFLPGLIFVIGGLCLALNYIFIVLERNEKKRIKETV